MPCSRRRFRSAFQYVRSSNVLVNLDQEQATDDAAKTLYCRWTGDDGYTWPNEDFEMRETHRCDADAALRAALRQN